MQTQFKELMRQRCVIVSFRLENEASPPTSPRSDRQSDESFHGSPYPPSASDLESILRGYPAKGGLGRCCAPREEENSSPMAGPLSPSLADLFELSCALHCFRASARSSAKRGDRATPPPIRNPLERVRGQENAPLPLG